MDCRLVSSAMPVREQALASSCAAPLDTADAMPDSAASKESARRSISSWRCATARSSCWCFSCSSSVTWARLFWKIWSARLTCPISSFRSVPAMTIE